MGFLKIVLYILAALIVINFLLLKFSCQKCNGKNLSPKESEKFRTFRATIKPFRNEK